MATTTCRSCEAPIAFEKNGSGGWNVLNADGSRHDCPKKQQQQRTGNVRSFGRSQAELHDIRREAVLNSAVAFASAKVAAGTEISGTDVIAMAKAFLRFVEEDRPE